MTEVVTDKTGTLTENRLELVRIVGDRRAVLGVALAAQATPANARAQVGDPVEVELAALPLGTELGLVTLPAAIWGPGWQRARCSLRPWPRSPSG